MAIHRFSECEWIRREMRNWREVKWNARMIEWKYSRYSCHLQTANVNRRDGLWFYRRNNCTLHSFERKKGICFKKIKMNWLWFTHSHFFLSLIDVSQSVCRRLCHTQNGIRSFAAGTAFFFGPSAIRIVHICWLESSCHCSRWRRQQTKIINVCLCYALSINIALQ